MTTLVWQRTTYSDAHQEYPTVYVRWGDVTTYLGCPHEGDLIQDAPGLYRAGRPCLPYQVLEDNGGGLHLAVFDSDDKCIWYASGYEHNPSGLREDIAALKEGSHPVADEWEPNLPEGYTPQQLYDDLTSCEYGWEIIADDVGTYPERMGASGCAVFGLDD